jgi:hypothetical protein
MLSAGTTRTWCRPASACWRRFTGYAGRCRTATTSPARPAIPELLAGALDITMTAYSAVPAEYAAEVQDVVKQAVDELARRQEAVMRGLLMGFVKVVEAYEDEDLRPDVLQLLQQLSLEVATEPPEE